MGNEDLGRQMATYLERVISQEDKVLFTEALRSAEAGAVRAAFMMVWISCAESLKRKFREAAVRDGNAQKVVGEITRKEGLHQSVDKYLLEEAKDYGFIDDSEHSRLEHVYTMRCIYGHPYEKLPSREELVAAADSVVDLVLSEPTKLRHGYLAEQVRLLTEDRHFLDDVPQAIAQYAEEVFNKADEALHLWFLRKLWEKLENIAVDRSLVLLHRRGVVFSASYLAKGVPDILENWPIVADLTRYPRTLSQVLSSTQLYPLIGDHAQDVVVSHLLESGATTGSDLAHMEALWVCDMLTGRQASRFTSALTGMPLAYVAASMFSPVLYADALIGELKKHNWYVQNPAIEVLRNMGPSGVGALPETTQIALGNNVLQSADGGASAAVSFLEELSTSTELWPEYFIQGVVAECIVNDRDEVRFKTTRGKEALLALRSVDAAASQAIMKRIVARIRSGRVRPEASWGRMRILFLRQIADTFAGDAVAFSELHELAGVLSEIDGDKYEL